MNIEHLLLSNAYSKHLRISCFKHLNLFVFVLHIYIDIMFFIFIIFW
jgi:hypothetical protein